MQALVPLSRPPSHLREAAQLFAWHQLVTLAKGQGCHQMIAIERAHLVGSYWSGQSQIDLLQRLVSMGASVVVPTTSNASSACMQNNQVSAADDRADALQVARLLQTMGVQPTYTCAPYYLDEPPVQGQILAWAESNAVVYANSVIGARTQKTPQYIDLLSAVCGYTPHTGLYTDEGRVATKAVSVAKSVLNNDTDYQLFGLWVGEQCGSEVVMVEANDCTPNNDQLRGFGSATSTSGNVPMFHWQGVTPEASQQSCTASVLRYDADTHRQMADRYASVYKGLPSAICIGTPHASFEELSRFIDSFLAYQADAVCPVYLSTSRFTAAKLDPQIQQQLVNHGVTLVVDTCTYYPTALAQQLSGWVATNSAKWAYYGQSNWQVNTRIMCIEALSALAVSRVLVNE